VPAARGAPAAAPGQGMNIAICHERLFPSRGGGETYVAGLIGRLAAGGHEVHPYSARWGAQAPPAAVRVHPVTLGGRPRFWRPWAFSSACRRLLRGGGHDVSLGFDKVAGVDVLYPQGGVHAATAEHNCLKYRSALLRALAGALRWLDPAHASFLALERRQCAGRPLVVALSHMVRRHCQLHLGVHDEDLRVLPIAPSPERLTGPDRRGARAGGGGRWGPPGGGWVALFVGLTSRLKGLGPLLHALAVLGRQGLSQPHLLVVGKPDAGPFPRLARRLGLAGRVRFGGYCRDIRDAYGAADFLTHPTFYDPCSNVALAALARRLP